ncbi:unnamed protein product, partial [Closterium sp. Naga37s-1]
CGVPHCRRRVCNNLPTAPPSRRQRFNRQTLGVEREGSGYSAAMYYVRIQFNVLNIKSGGAAPNIAPVSSCKSSPATPGALSWINITSDKAARRKRYSF